MVGAVLLIAATIALTNGIRAQKHAPQPPASAASPVAVVPSEATARASTSSSSSTAVRGRLSGRSTPTHLSVPAIGIDSSLKRIGLDHAGRIQTPPLTRDSHAYWLTVSPTPGQLGPATIIGHVDSAAYGAGVFFRLGALRQRDEISVDRADGTVAVFAVERVVKYQKTRFPTHAVYGNTGNAALRLITCGGLFNSATHSYESNIVVYASLIATHHK
jgi:hypothetical protein